mgnify:CR=1 FL=1
MIGQNDQTVGFGQYLLLSQSVYFVRNKLIGQSIYNFFGRTIRNLTFDRRNIRTFLCILS